SSLACAAPSGAPQHPGGTADIPAVPMVAGCADLWASAPVRPRPLLAKRVCPTVRCRSGEL
ncbi:MAG: hypothetical protein WAO08_13265, partial [Hyphomicrobiaceae bacterium]